jgi:predicted nucleic acid-binding protein
VSTAIDASVLVGAVTDAGAEGRWAEAIIAGSSLVAPALLLVEATNILRRLELAKKLTRSEASFAYADMLRLDVELFPFEPFADRIWELRAGVTSYDAWYVAVAESLQLPLATLDRKLSRASGPRCAFMLPAAS